MRHAPRDEGVRGYHEVVSDGLLDVFIGMLVLVLIAYGAVSQESAATPLAPQAALLLSLIALFAGFEFVRRHVTYRRIEHPDQTADLERRQAIVMFAILISLLVSVGLPFVLPWVAKLADGYFVPVLLAGVVTFVSGTIALAFASPRFWLYAGLFGLPMLLQKSFAGAGLPSDLGVYFGVAAGIAVLVGLSLLLRFVRRHPLPPTGQRPSTASHA